MIIYEERDGFNLTKTIKVNEDIQVEFYTNPRLECSPKGQICLKSRFDEEIDLCDCTESDFIEFAEHLDRLIKKNQT